MPDIPATRFCFPYTILTFFKEKKTEEKISNRCPVAAGRRENKGKGGNLGSCHTTEIPSSSHTYTLTLTSIKEIGPFHTDRISLN